MADSPPSEAVTPPADEPPAHVAKRQKLVHHREEEEVVHHREEEEVAHLLAGFASSSSRSQQLLPLQTSPPALRGPVATPQPQWGDVHANRRRVEAAIAAADLEAPARPTCGGSGANQAERARQERRRQREESLEDASMPRRVHAAREAAVQAELARREQVRAVLSEIELPSWFRPAG